MNEIVVYFLIAFLFKIYCEQRQLLYSRVKKDQLISSPAVFYQDAESALYCGVLCSIDAFCNGFGFNTNSNHCFGVHDFKREDYSYQHVPSMSDEILWYRSAVGCGPHWLEFKGHCYFYGKHQTVSWFDAKINCQNRFSHLVEIEDKAESDWLASTFLNPDGNYANCPSNIFGGCSAWTGLNDLNIEGQYIWDHSNTSMVFTNWYIFEPSLGNVGDCFDILRNGEWNDRLCSELVPFICEKEISLL